MGYFFALGFRVFRFVFFLAFFLAFLVVMAVVVIWVS